MGQCSSTMGGNNKLVTDSASAASPASPRFFHKAHRSELTLRRLMDHVARGDQDKDIPQIKEILTKRPELLLQESHTIDLSGRSFTGLSPWQLAWCAGDDDMVEKMKTYTQSSKLDQSLMADQLHKLFSGSYEAHLAQQEASTFNFDAIAKAISEATNVQLLSAIHLEGAVLPVTYAWSGKEDPDNAQPLTTELNKFRRAFTVQSLHEKVFNPKHLLRALEIYFARCYGWSYNQRRVFWSQVVGFTQRFMPACYAQAFCYGLYFLTVRPNRVAPTRSFRIIGGEFFSDMSSFSALGFKFGVVWREASVAGPGGGGSSSFQVSSAFKELCQTKTDYFANLFQNLCSSFNQHRSRPR